MCQGRFAIMAAAYNFSSCQNNIYNPNNQSSQSARTIDDDDRVCRSCHSHNLRVDWAQGDRVCTDCGVVDESHILDDRPEWKDFGEAEDLVKGLPSGARSGLVVVDESKYLGGLQPTVLSKHVFGNCPIATTTTNIRKSLNATNRKMDRFMEKEQKRALQRAKLSLALKRKQIDVGEECDVRPEHDAFLLHEEQESERAHAALFREKWSLHRALLLHGHNLDESTSVSPSSSSSSSSSSILEERAELVARLDKTLKRASYDLYTAYTILQRAAQRLELAPRILHQATNTLCRYAAQKDGLTVKGVSSRISESNNDNAADGSSPTNSSSSVAVAEAAAQLKTYNRQKQMAALASAILFVEARKHGHARPLQEVCAAFQYPAGINSGNAANDDGINRQNNFIKPKHCSKAMKELRILFPEYMRATNASVNSETSLNAVSQERGSDNFVEHATRKLELPPVATASIQILVEELQGKVTESKMSTTCAAVTLLVCMAGAIMQRLARQAMDPSTMATKRLKTGDDSNIKLGTRIESGMDLNVKKETSGKKLDATPKKFDMFLHPAAVVDVPSYEMRQMWDAWTEQMPWGRSLAALEQAFHISKPAVLEFFRTKIYPQRVELLSLLQESTKLRATPRATVLLSQMCSTASPLLNSQGKVV